MSITVNRAARTQALLRFCALFLLTISLVIVAVYFNFKVPEKQNQLLRRQTSLQDQRISNEKKFERLLLDIKNKIDTLNYRTTGDLIAEQAVKIKLEALLRLNENEMNYKIMNQVMIETMYDLLKLSSAVRESNKKASLADELQIKLEKCQAVSAMTSPGK